MKGSLGASKFLTGGKEGKMEIVYIGEELQNKVIK